jgi:hypothetical protein
MKNKLSPVIVCGFGGAVFSVVPIIKSCCCIYIPLAVIAALYLDQRIRGNRWISVPEGVSTGMLTGVAAALFAMAFELTATFIARSNDLTLSLNQIPQIYGQMGLPKELIDQAMQMLHSMRNDITKTGFSLLYSIGIFVMNITGYFFFGLIGGLIGPGIINNKIRR